MEPYHDSNTDGRIICFLLSKIQMSTTTSAISCNFLGQILEDGVRRSQDNQGRRYNLMAASLISDIVKTFLGPCGMEKMFIDVLGEMTITKDGATFLRKIDVEHPAAKAIIDAAVSVDNEVGDGTTSVAVLTGALVKRANELLNLEVAPPVIIDGYHDALVASLDILYTLSQKTDNSDRRIMLSIAKTCLDSKLISLPSLSDPVARVVVDAVATVSDFKNNKVEIDNIKIEEKIGDPLETKLVHGIAIDKSIDSPEMPRIVRNAKVLLIDQELEFKGTRFDAEVRVDSPQHLQSFSVASLNRIKNMVQSIIGSGANIVISRKGIDLIARNALAKSQVISLRRVKENDMQWIAGATGAKITKDLSSTSLSSCLGHAGLVHESYVGQDRMVFVEECINPKSVTILLRSSSKIFLDEYHRSVLSGLQVLQSYVANPLTVYGAGSLELLLSERIRKIARMTSGKKQIVLQKFAEALEEIPLTIAKNAGMNELDTTAVIRSRMSEQGHGKLCWYGINASERRVDDMRLRAIIEPVSVKEQVLKTAVEVTCLLVRVDDVLLMKPVTHTHTHADGTKHSHSGGDKKHDHYFDRLGKQQRPTHHYF